MYRYLVLTMLAVAPFLVGCGPGSNTLLSTGSMPETVPPNTQSPQEQQQDQQGQNQQSQQQPPEQQGQDQQSQQQPPEQQGQNQLEPVQQPPSSEENDENLESSQQQQGSDSFTSDSFTVDDIPPHSDCLDHPDPVECVESTTIFFIPDDHPCWNDPRPGLCVIKTHPEEDSEEDSDVALTSGSLSFNQLAQAGSIVVATSGSLSFNSLGNWAEVSGSTLAFGYHDDQGWIVEGTPTAGPSELQSGTVTWSGEFIGERQETNPRRAKGDVSLSMDLSSALRPMSASFTNMRMIEADERTIALSDRSFLLQRSDDGTTWTATGVAAQFYSVGDDDIGAFGGTLQDNEVNGVWGAVRED